MTMKIKFFFTVFLFSAFLPFCFSDQTYSLQECLEKASACNPSLVEGKKLQEAAALQTKQAKTLFYPSADLSASSGTVSEASQIRFEGMSFSSPLTRPNDSSTTMQIGEKDRSELMLNVNQPLYTAGILQNKAAAAKEREISAGYGVQLTEDQIHHEVIRIFYQLVKVMEMKKVAYASREQIDQHLQDAKNLLNQGMVMKNELLTIDMKKCDIDLMIVQSENSIAKIKANLAERMGRPPGEGFEIESAFRENPPWPIPSDLLQENHLRLEQQVAGKSILASEAEMRALKGSLQPQVGMVVSAHHGWPGFTANDPAWTTWWQAGIQVSWNIFDMGRKHLAIQELRAGKEKLQSQLESLNLKISLERLNARLDYEEGRKKMEIAAKKVVSAQENFRIVEDQFRSGTASNATYLDAQTDLTRAKLEEAVALADFRIAWADFLMSLGEIKRFLGK
jgi:outer membrane protein